jgi:hypothetical protein
MWVHSLTEFASLTSACRVSFGWVMATLASGHVRRGGALLLSALAVACGMEAPDARTSAAAESAAHDSAGVRVVANGQAGWSGWRVDTTPQFTVGWGADDPAFTWIQSGRILPDGGAVVGNFTAGSILRIGPEGSVVAIWGGSRAPSCITCQPSWLTVAFCLFLETAIAACPLRVRRGFSSNSRSWQLPWMAARSIRLRNCRISVGGTAPVPPAPVRWP